MKLTYEQMRALAQLGPSNDRILLKNKKGQILKPAIDKWHPNLKETRFTCMEEPRKRSHALTVSHSPISPPVSYSPLLRRPGRQ